VIAFMCSHCDKPLRVRDDLAGKRAKCPACGQAISIPAPSGNLAHAGSDVAKRSPNPDSAETENTLPPRAPDVYEEQLSATRTGNFANHDTDGDGSKTHGGHPAELTDFLAPPQAADEIGRLGPYRVLAILGRGGMGVVYRAEDPNLQRLLALKAMLPGLATSPSAKERFFREARAAAALKHPHIVTIFQVGEDRGAPFLAMEFLEGESLDDRVKREIRLPVPDILRIGKEVADGLEAAHERGLIHRDIKPGNIWLEGKKGHVKILDFGLARAMSGQSQLTQSGAIVGTPAYMAPEQACGRQIDHRCDLFSLGCVLYRMCTGVLPFKGNDTMAIIASLALDTPASPASLNPELPAELSDLVMQLLAKEPEGRPADSRAVSEALLDIMMRTTQPVVEAMPRAARAKSVAAANATSGDPWQGIDDSTLSVGSQTEAIATPTLPAPPTKIPKSHKKTRKSRGSRTWIALAALLLLGALGALAVWQLTRGSRTDTLVVKEDTSGKRDPARPAAVKAEANEISGKGVNSPKGPAVPQDLMGFQPLFNGKDLAGWEKVSAGDWTVKDGILRGSGEGRGWLATHRDYADFDLELEYRLGPKGNTGVFVHAWKDGDASGGQFLEVQLIDDVAYNTVGQLNGTACIFGVVAAKPTVTSIPDKWHKVEILSRGRRLKITFDGKQVVDANLDEHAASFQRFPGLTKTTGRLGLQYFGTPVEFRNIRLRP